MLAAGPSQDVVTLAPDDDERALGFRFVLEQVDQTVARDRGHASIGHGNAAQLEKGRREIDGADQLAHAAAGFDDAPGPAHHQRHAMRVVEGVALYAREGHAVVGSNDDQRIRRFAAGVECGQQLAHVRIEPFDLQGIVEQVAAHDVVVWQVRGHVVDIVQLLASGQAGPGIVAPMRIAAAVPIEEGRTVRSRLEELRE